MLHRCPAPFLSSASRINLELKPRATPVSTTFAGRKCRTKHQTVRTNPGSPSPHPPKAPRPILFPFACSGPITSGHKAQNSEIAVHGQGTPRRSCNRRSQSGSVWYRQPGLSRSRRSFHRASISINTSSGSVATAIANRCARLKYRTASPIIIACAAPSPRIFAETSRTRPVHERTPASGHRRANRHRRLWYYGLPAATNDCYILTSNAKRNPAK
jgi:hypothetical protein